MSTKLKVIIVVIPSIIVILALVYLLNINGVFAKEAIDITSIYGRISWSIKDDKDLQGGYYVLYQDGKEVYKGVEPQFSCSSLEDKEAPEEVTDFNIKYEYMSLYYELSWDKPKDIGTDYSFMVYYVDKSGLIKYKSSEYTYNHKTGVDSFKVNVGNNSFEAGDSTLVIYRDQLEIGELDISIIAVDKHKNSSNPKLVDSIKNYPLDLVNDGSKYTIINSDQEQEYRYSLLLVDEIWRAKTFPLEGNTFDIMNFSLDFTDRIPSIEYIYDFDGGQLFYVNPRLMTGAFIVEGLGTTYGNKIYSQVYSNAEAKEMYYAVNQDNSYKITTTDAHNDCITGTSYVYIYDHKDMDYKDLDIDDTICIGIDRKEGQKPYYLHVALLDEVTNTLTDTFSYKITFDEQERKELAESHLTKSENLSNVKYLLERDNFAKLPIGIFKIIDYLELKIIFVDGYIGTVYDPELDEEIECETPGVYSDHIYINSEFEDYSIIVHELGHAVDFYNYLTQDMYLHMKDDFMEIFYKERDEFYHDLYYVRESPCEYFAETFSEFIHNPWKLRKFTPLSYEYMKNLFDSL